MSLPVPLNLATAWEAAAEVVPDADAVVCQSVSRTWREFEDRAARLAAALGEFGIGAGDNVGLYLYNGNPYSEVTFAAFKVRAAPCNVNYRYLSSELRHLLEDADAKAVFFSPELADRVNEARAHLPLLRAAIQVGDPGDPVPDWALDYEALIAEHDPALPIDRSPDDLWILYTGGTTGKPKGVMWPHSSLIGAMAGPFRALTLPLPETIELVKSNIAAIYDTNRVTRQLAASPLMHGTASIIALSTFTQGGAVITMPERSFDADALWRCVERDRATVLSIVGDAFGRPMAEALDAAAARGEPYDLSSVFMIMSSGVIWSQPAKEALLVHKDMKLVDSLGSSEGTGTGMRISDRKGGSATGRFSLGENAAVFDEDGLPVEPGSGQQGMVAVGGPIPIGYYKDPEKTAATFRTIGGRRWSVPGDWATVEADGTITLLGRGSACINSAGEKIYPEEVEEAVKAHPAVVDCLVVGVPDPKWGEAVTAVVQMAELASDDEVIADARTRLAAYKLPKSLIRADAVQRGANGKPDYQWAKQFALDSLSVD
ncbi:MAG: AMP-binding protein [Acidimicrobiia bacterium]|nr:AMP-binding protein [Acidimicrobiia bacterium]MYG59839.1 AMP-binding protein [Acidimicrobiia bacterium]MYJ32756.1 AMP-binding protein [Acidimicrobiia bacterium]